jgi:hypothetical protein
MSPASVNLALILQPLSFPSVPPVSKRGNVNEIIGKLSGADQLRTAFNQLQSCCMQIR